MSQHGCPERLSNRSKGYQEDGPSQPTMEVLVETLTGTAFEMTVSPSDTIFAIKSKIFRVEGIPVSQQHLLYNLRELDDGLSLSEHSITDGAKLRLVLGLRVGPVSTRRLPPPEPWRDIDRLLRRSDDDDAEWGSSNCKATVLVFREGERVNLVRVSENRDGTYSPLDHAKYSSLRQLAEAEAGPSTSALAGAEAEAGGALRDNARTLTKMQELRRRMETLSLQRRRHVVRGDKRDIKKTRSEETLSVPFLDETNDYPRNYTTYEDFTPLYDGNYTRYEYDCSFSDKYTLLPPIGRTDSDQSIQEITDERIKLSDALSGSILVKSKNEDAILEECLDTDECLRQDSKNMAPIAAEYGPLVSGSVYIGGGGWCSASALPVRAPLGDALFSSSTSDLETLKRNRILPALSRHRNREHLHLSDEGLDLSRHEPPRNLEIGSERRQRKIDKINEDRATEKIEKKITRIRCGLCRKRLSIATVHKCRCGQVFCAPHRYAEAHGCSYDYKACAPSAPPPRAPKLPEI